MAMRRWLWLLAIIVVVGLGIAFYMLRPVTGPARDLTLVGDAARGAQLIRIGGCVTCHTDTKSGVSMLGGGPGLKTPFGTFYAPNITPDPEAGIGNWTIEQFARAMSDGEGPEGHLYPAFPYEHYTLMSDQEIADLFAAIKQMPPVATEAKPHDVSFPFNVRLALAGWKNLFFKPQRYAPDPAHSEQWNRGRYLAYGPGHCVMCHSPRNLLGALEVGKELTGNPAGGTGGKAPALTAEALTEGGYDETTLVEALKTGFTPEFDVLGGAMGEVVADETSHWTDEDLAAVAAYLLGEG
jgi:mono/diheme cytochrome c family protein